MTQVANVIANHHDDSRTVSDTIATMAAFDERDSVVGPLTNSWGPATGSIATQRY